MSSTLYVNLKGDLLVKQVLQVGQARSTEKRQDVLIHHSAVIRSHLPGKIGYQIRFLTRVR